MLFGGDSCGSGKHVLDGGAHWRHLANTIKLKVGHLLPRTYAARTPPPGQHPVGQTPPYVRGGVFPRGRCPIRVQQRCGRSLPLLYQLAFVIGVYER